MTIKINKFIYHYTPKMPKYHARNDLFYLMQFKKKNET